MSPPLSALRVWPEGQKQCPGAVFMEDVHARNRVMFQKVCLFIPIVPDEVIKIAQKIDLDQF